MAVKRKGCGLIRMIQKAIRDLGLREEEYRDLYERVAGTRSLSAMQPWQRWKIVEALKIDYGFETTASAQSVPLCDKPQARKIRSLWLELRDMGVLRNISEAALLAYVKRLTGVERMEWLDAGQLSYVIETLKSWLARVEGEKHRPCASTAEPQNQQAAS